MTRKKSDNRNTRECANTANRRQRKQAYGFVPKLLKLWPLVEADSEGVRPLPVYQNEVR